MSKETKASIKREATKKLMLEALEKRYGIVTIACKDVGIKRQTHYRWMKEDIDYMEAVNEIDNVSLDFVESKLLERVKNGSDSAILFYLKTKGRKRGYTESSSIDITSDGQPVKLLFDSGDKLKS